jgi:hypothetical protein
MHRVLPPSEPPDGERPRFFRLVVVGGTQLRGSWYLSAIVRLQGFSSGSPTASPRRWSPKTVTTRSMVGRSEPGPAFAWAGVPPLPASGGENHPPTLWRRRPLAMPGKANCCCPARVQHSILCPGDGGQPHREVSLHSRFRGEDGSEDLPVRFGAGGGEPPGVSSPRRPSNVGGCSYLRGWNRSSVCNGTLSAGVCSLWLSGPEHLCILA